MSQKVKELRERTGLGMQECKSHVMNQELTDEINELECSDNLKWILTTLVDRSFPKISRLDDRFDLDSLNQNSNE